MSGYSEMKSDAGWFGLGLGVTGVLSAVFAFYPAFVISIAVKRHTHGVSEDGDMVGIGIFLLVIAIAIILSAAKQYFIVLVLYIITAWPFLCILGHFCHAGEWRDGVYIEHYPVPPLDWWPLW